MQNSPNVLFLIFLPSETVRRLNPLYLENFGTSDFGYSLKRWGSKKDNCKSTCESNLSVFLVSQHLDVNIGKEFIKDVLPEMEKFDTLYILSHNNFSEISKQLSLIEDAFPGLHTIKIAYHHGNNNVFQSIGALVKSIRSEADQKIDSNLLLQLQSSLEIDSSLELELRNNLDDVRKLNFDSTLDFILLWNDNMLDWVIPNPRIKAISTSLPMLRRELKKNFRLVILAELNWEERPYAHFYGYEIAENLISQGWEGELIIVSFTNREKLKRKSQKAQLLAPIFPHIHITSDRLILPESNAFSSAKWGLIREYYIKPDGIVDKLIHDLRKIDERSSEKDVLGVLNDLLGYRAVLSKDIVEYAETALLNKGRKLSFIRMLYVLLERYYRELVGNSEDESPEKNNFKIILVEDDQKTLDALRTGLSRHFHTVKSFDSGKKALKELTKNHLSYSAAVVDLELLDTNKNWQKVQGLDILEQLQKYPHLAIVILTNYSRRALVHIQKSINLSKFILQMKDPQSGIPIHISYADFSAQLVELIRLKSLHRVGPINGIWRSRGLLAQYYNYCENIEIKAELWNDVKSVVEGFIEAGLRNNPKSRKLRSSFPTTLPSHNKRKLTESDLADLLKHRLYCLYEHYQNDRKGVNYQNTVVKHLRVRRELKAYFTTLLGFSGTVVEHEEKASTKKYIIKPVGLFPEEIYWLKKRFDNSQFVRFSGLIQMILDTESHLRYQSLGIRDELLNTKPLMACLRALEKALEIKFTEEEAFDIAIDLDIYFKDHSLEIQELSTEKESKRILACLDELKRVLA